MAEEAKAQRDSTIRRVPGSIPVKVLKYKYVFFSAINKCHHVREAIIYNQKSKVDRLISKNKFFKIKFVYYTNMLNSKTSVC